MINLIQPWAIWKEGLNEASCSPSWQIVHRVLLTVEVIVPWPMQGIPGLCRRREHKHTFTDLQLSALDCVYNMTNYLKFLFLWLLFHNGLPITWKAELSKYFILKFCQSIYYRTRKRKWDNILKWKYNSWISQGETN